MQLNWLIALPNDDTEFIASARAAGLRYVTDASPGIRRRGAGKGFIYLDPQGRRISDRKTIERIKKIVIPPAWNDVWICPSPQGHIQATGSDAKRRKQYRYHPKYRAVRDETKFERVLKFSKVFPKLRRRVERDLRRPGVDRRKMFAVVVYLLETTLIRVGNEEYARDNESYGLTTLQDHHAEVEGGRITFAFPGKSGVDHAISFSDHRLARIIQRCQDLPGEQLFKYEDDEGGLQSIDSGDINAYLAEITGGDFTAKDVRTWAGTVLAAAALRDFGVAHSKREAERNIRRALDQVARHLGNTRAVCLHYYVHPMVLKKYRAGQVISAPLAQKKYQRKSPRAVLRRDEAAVLDLIQ
ncbi:MAG: DNA topoisomerase I [Betaproteobacteria bacterium SG8_39]|nr:MAG: DNA topoisomerase I [Betaproteobacteria bacterium SG8_39]